MRRHSWVVLSCLLLVLLINGVIGITGAEVPVYKDASAPIDLRVEDLLSRMTLAEKIGQMTQAERGAITPQEVRRYFIGSVLSGGGSAPSPNTAENWAQMYDGFQKAAMSTRLGIPILYGTDAVHGHNNLWGATIFPHNIGLGATRDPELLERIGRITALETKATGANWTFSPCVAVARDVRWGRTYESFGETPELQRLLVGSYIKGLQGPNAEMGGEYLVATAKHFLGDGGATWGTGGAGYKIDRGNVAVSEEELRAIHLPGYLEAIKAGVGTIMVAFNSYQGMKMHEHKYLITDVLKNELGFDGFVITDWEGIREIPAPNYYQKVVRAVNAGIDMFMEPNGWRDFITNLEKAVRNGDVSEERIDDAVRRILRVKFKAGLFDAPYANRDLLAQKLIGCEAHRAVAREAVRKSLVLLKNENNLLPLAKESRIYIAGSNADDLGNQCGGWTITWQGKSGPITIGTTIREGIEAALKEPGRLVSNLDEADVAVVVVGEKPYAEGVGDNGKLTLGAPDLMVLNQVKAAGVPVVVIIVSGRPLMITHLLKDWDALVAAWLPGTEGQGVADVLFGDYNFTGKLPVTWPKDLDRYPLNYGDADYDPLFSYGYGLAMDLKK
ncbi:glycoside hydrolase family 3 protein [Capillibacterium thermochitinicola]|uniref:beta-glucosidase n=1 Tax=Capillibacterium thermochitinicola TaxID=2699427 RepID=A0A8J6HSN2_9FIRM|nr:glycoside hydrolase family 3 N-terminal domain-containing protein [Capillibacterium thermochitinicola]MBA2133431.1 glycoside hydrolase family 3 C-terminal domain-containing protein [Capillibacterium thermochitinicola]